MTPIPEKCPKCGAESSYVWEGMTTHWTCGSIQIGDTCRAARDIRVGEELTLDYNTLAARRSGK